MIRVRTRGLTALAGFTLAATIGLTACSASPSTVSSSKPAASPLATTPAIASSTPIAPSQPTTSTAPSAPTPSASTTPPPTTTPSTPPPTTFTNLKLGNKGTAVMALQQRLTTLGYWLGKPDGKFGDSTQQAVFALQKAASIGRSGSITAATQTALERGTRPTARSKSGTLIEVDLNRDLVLFVTDGQVKYILNTSTGGGYVFYQDGVRNVAITPKGRFKTYRVIDGPDNGPLGLLWRPRYFTGGIAIHGDGYVPAHPVSHGCVRISDAAMNWIWATKSDPIGTTIWVY